VGEQESAPSGIDTRIPNMARMYDYALGGKDNFAADRAAVEKLFLDLGTGLPSQGHAHEIVGEIRPGAHVVYVDYDPVVVNHARALLMDSDSVTAVRADIRDLDSILGHPGVTGLIDFSRPVADVPVLYRSRAEILRMFDGFDLVEPGLTPVTQWRGNELDSKLDAAGLWWLGGVGRRE
jgi:hypothetical protein